MSKSTLAQAQAALVSALVAGGPLPTGFDTDRVAVAQHALRRKRAGEVARVWPILAASLGDAWIPCFCRWSAGKPPRGSLRDGWDLARELADRDQLSPRAARELAFRDTVMRYDGRRDPRRRMLPTIRRVPGGLAFGALGRGHLLWR
ncbi:hypothetical protein [Pseudonocardia spinosispora]|uniref:hypothetical protein n=1 Tax=Pseudonocardia spinosispora TaxID=103441 RepID=UPI00040C0EBE|nr:hypothetical protein [Pseudonocardia spinosispora]